MNLLVKRRQPSCCQTLFYLTTCILLMLSRSLLSGTGRRHSRRLFAAAFTQVPRPQLHANDHRSITSVTHRWQYGKQQPKGPSPPPPSSSDGSTQRAPRLFRRTHLRGKKRQKTDTLLYRADRVLANRTGKSRKECFQLLKERRVFLVKGRDEQGKFESSLLLEVVPGPKSKIEMNAELRIDRKHDVPRPPPLMAVYHKPKVGG